MGRSDQKIVDGVVRDETDTDEPPADTAGIDLPDGDTAGTNEPAATAGGTDTTTTGRLKGLFSLKAFLLSTALIGVGVVGGGAIPIVGTVGSLGGLFVAAFIIGLVAAERRYLETAIAGGSIIGLSFALSLLTTGVLPVGMRFFREYGLVFGGVGVGIGVLLAVVGHYFGRDLRDGLTQEI